MDDDLFPQSDWKFVVDGGEKHVNGKTHYPALLRLMMNSKQMINLAADLCHCASFLVLKPDEVHGFLLAGSIEKLEDEEHR